MKNEQLGDVSLGMYSRSLLDAYVLCVGLSRYMKLCLLSPNAEM